MSDKVETAEVFGIAKKWTLELEKYPIEVQGAVISHMNTSLQLRQISEKRAHEEKQQALQERQQEAYAQAVENQRRQQAIEKSGLVLAQ